MDVTFVFYTCYPQKLTSSDPDPFIVFLLKTKLSLQYGNLKRSEPLTSKY